MSVLRSRDCECEDDAGDAEYGDAEKRDSVAPGGCDTGGFQVGAEQRIKQLGFQAGALGSDKIIAESGVLGGVKIGKRPAMVACSWAT